MDKKRNCGDAGLKSESNKEALLTPNCEQPLTASALLVKALGGGWDTSQLPK